MANKAILLKNELNIKFRITPKSPLLVKSSSSKDAEGTNTITWLLKKDKNNEEKPYIPGSTLKGLFREKFTMIYYDFLNLDSEKLENLHDFQESEDNINKFDKYMDYMEEKVNSDKSDKIPREDVYTNSLLTEQLFGSKVLKGRFWASDASIEGKYEPLEFKDKNKISGEAKSITPIDRFTGGAVVPLNFEYTFSDFSFDMKIKNITKDELKFLLFIVRDSQNGELRIGSSKTRGFGQVELSIDDLFLKKYNNQKDELDIDKYTTIEETGSIKIGNQYLVENHRLKDEYKKVSSNNEFVGKICNGGENK